MTAMKTLQISTTYIDGVQPAKGWNTAENAPDRPAYAGFEKEGGKTVEGGGMAYSHPVRCPPGSIGVMGNPVGGYDVF